MRAIVQCVVQFADNVGSIKVNKKAKIKNWYNQEPHLTQETTWESD